MPAVKILKQSLKGGTRWSSECDASLDQILERSPFDITARTILGGSTVLLFGAGSGGGKLVHHLAQAGVGKIRICDPGRLTLHNLSRHIGSLAEVGEPKVEVIARYVLKRVPEVILDTYAWDLFSHDSPLAAEELIADADLIIAATDRLKVQLAINRAAWKNRKPAVFGGCYESAKGGEVFFTLPEQGTPCLACLRGGFAQPDPDGSFDYSAAQSIEDYQGQPGLSAAVDLITDVEAQIALAVLLRHTGLPLAKLADPRLCLLLIGGAQGDGYYRFQRPFDIHYQPLAGPRSGCPICQTAAVEVFDVMDLPSEISEILPSELQSFNMEG